MHVDEGVKKHVEGTRSLAERQRAKGRFYHAYVDSVITFLVPKGKRVLQVDESFSGFEQGHMYEYVVMSDVLGHVHDVEEFLREARGALAPNGRVVVTQYNSLWEPLLRLASALHLRAPSEEQNWLSPHDLRNFLYLAGFETIREGNKMLLPIYVPLLSSFCNTLLANIWPLSKLGLIHYVVARPLPSARTDSPSISIIVPARNEAGTIERIVKELPTLGAYTEIIFIEGHSKDKTLAEIERVAAAYTDTKHILCATQDGKGKGDAVRKGFAMATGDILAIYDADMTVPPEDVEKFYRAIVSGAGEFINGSRLVYPVEKGAMRILNFFGNKFFSLAFTTILGQSLKDTLCGTKVLWKKDYESIQDNRAFFGDFDPFGDFDLLFGAAKLNLKIVEVPVRYKERVYGETNISRWSHGWLLLQMTIFAARKLRFW
jgi:hypothetical protein